MEVEPKAIFAGLNEQVPDPQARAMVSVKVPGGNKDVMDMVKVVVVVPMGRDCVREGEVRLKSGFPVPVKVIADAPPTALSVMLRLPLRIPVLVGVKVIVKAQLAFTASVNGVEGQVLVCAKSPWVVMLVTVKGVWPLLVMRTVCDGLVVFKT